jgi:hypothetical protein
VTKLKKEAQPVSNRPDARYGMGKYLSWFSRHRQNTISGNSTPIDGKLGAHISITKSLQSRIVYFLMNPQLRDRFICTGTVNPKFNEAGIISHSYRLFICFFGKDWWRCGFI